MTGWWVIIALSATGVSAILWIAFIRLCRASDKQAREFTTERANWPIAQRRIDQVKQEENMSEKRGPPDWLRHKTKLTAHLCRRAKVRIGHDADIVEAETILQVLGEELRGLPFEQSVQLIVTLSRPGK